MFSTLRTRFGIPGVISVIALVFAMFGGAYAASNSTSGGKATASAKAKKGPRGPKGATGPAGPAGAQGPAGPAGAKGDAGANGSNGADGAKGANGATGNKGATGAAGATGATGFSGFTSTLPSGKTETGTFAFKETAPLERLEPISFPIPLAGSLGESAVHVINADGSKELSVTGEVTPTKCGVALTPAGTTENPAAAPGNLCVYLKSLEGALTSSGLITNPSSEPCEAAGCLPDFGGPGAGAGVSGALLHIEPIAEVQSGYGTWAVTAP